MRVFRGYYALPFRRLSLVSPMTRANEPAGSSAREGREGVAAMTKIGSEDDELRRARLAALADANLRRPRGRAHHVECHDRFSAVCHFDGRPLGPRDGGVDEPGGNRDGAPNAGLPSGRRFGAFAVGASPAIVRGGRRGDPCRRRPRRRTARQRFAANPLRRRIGRDRRPRLQQRPASPRSPGNATIRRRIRRPPPPWPSARAPAPTSRPSVS